MKNGFNKKLIAIIFATILLSNNKAYGWDFRESIWNPVSQFFTARTNPILRPSAGIIPNATETISSLTNKIAILDETYNSIPRQIETLNKIGNTTIDMADNSQTLSGVQSCVEQYRSSTQKVLGFMSKYSTPIKKWFGLRTSYDYPTHDTIAKNGLISNPEYLENLTQLQKQALQNFEQCVEQVSGSEKIIDKPWFKKLIQDRGIINKQAFLTMLEKLKYHGRGILETITPDNQYLKYALIIGTIIVSSYITYKAGKYILSKLFSKQIPTAPGVNITVNQPRQ